MREDSGHKVTRNSPCRTERKGQPSTPRALPKVPILQNRQKAGYGCLPGVWWGVGVEREPRVMGRRLRACPNRDSANHKRPCRPRLLAPSPPTDGHVRVPIVCPACGQGQGWAGKASALLEKPRTREKREPRKRQFRDLRHGRGGLLPVYMGGGRAAKAAREGWEVREGDLKVRVGGEREGPYSQNPRM